LISGFFLIGCLGGPTVSHFSFMIPGNNLSLISLAFIFIFAKCVPFKLDVKYIYINKLKIHHTFTKVALSIDRYDAITHPMNFSGSWRRARGLVAAAWILSGSC